MGETPSKEVKKVFDEADEAFCGYVSIQTLDQDGIAGRTLGAHVKGPLHIVSEPGADLVVMEALFLATNPLFYLEIRNEEQFFLFGQWWMDGPTHSEAGQICTMLPLKMQDCHKQMEKTPNEFKGQAVCECLRNSSTRLFDVQFASVEKKFKTKMTKVSITIPREAWTEYKHNRVRLWKASKNTFAAGGKEKEEKKEEGKDKDE